MTTPFKKASYCLAKASKFLRLECVVNGGLAKVLPQKNEMFASVAVFFEREREKERTSKGKLEKPFECVVNGVLAKVLPQKKEMSAPVAVFFFERARASLKNCFCF